MAHLSEALRSFEGSLGELWASSPYQSGWRGGGGVGAIGEAKGRGAEVLWAKRSQKSYTIFKHTAHILTHKDDIYQKEQNVTVNVTEG